MSNNVDNYFAQTNGTDNALNLGGTVQTGGGQSLKKIYITVDMTDISTASTVYVASPVAGDISKIQTIINGSISNSDAVITGKIGAVAITGGAVTIAYSGSAAGDVDSVSPSAANTVAVGDNINFTTDGASTHTVRATILVEITQS